MMMNIKRKLRIYQGDIQWKIESGVHIKGQPYPKHNFNFIKNEEDYNILTSNKGIAEQLNVGYTNNPSQTYTIYFYIVIDNEIF